VSSFELEVELPGSMKRIISLSSKQLSACQDEPRCIELVRMDNYGIYKDAWKDGSALKHC
jgi:hypothetical protein